MKTLNEAQSLLYRAWVGSPEEAEACWRQVAPTSQSGGYRLHELFPFASLAASPGSLAG